MPSIEFSMATNPRSTSPALDGVEHVGHRAVEHELGLGEVGLRLQCLLGERAEWAEEADTSCWTNHVSQAIGTRSLQQSDMTGNPDSPAMMSVTGGAVLARTWYGQMRSAFAKPHVELMSNAPGATTPPTRRNRCCVAWHDPVAAIRQTCRVAGAGRRDATRSRRHRRDDHPPGRGRQRRLLRRRRRVRGVDQPLRPRRPTTSVPSRPAMRSASSACSTTCLARRPFAARRPVTS